MSRLLVLSWWGSSMSNMLSAAMLWEGKVWLVKACRSEMEPIPTSEHQCCKDSEVKTPSSRSIKLT